MTGTIENIRVDDIPGMGYKIRGDVKVDHDLVMELWSKFMTGETIDLKVEFEIPYREMIIYRRSI